MKVCNNCNENKIFYSEEINICPHCGNILENLNNVSKLNTISIEMDFTAMSCDCGEKFFYETVKCPRCGEKYEDYKDSIDPKSKLRKERFSEILDLINKLDLEIKNLQKNIEEGKLKKALVSDVMSFFQYKIEKINTLSDTNIFKNVCFYSDELESQHTNIHIQKIKDYIMSLYTLHKELVTTEVTYAWKNMFFRLYEISKKYLNVNKIIIKSIIADNFTESKKIMKLGQTKLDSASEDLEVFSDMIQIKGLEENIGVELSVFDIMELNKINELTLGSVGDDFIKLQNSSYKYFKEFLPNDIEYYKSLDFQILSNLCVYKVEIIRSFLEIRFRPKVRNVVKVLELAKNRDLELLKEVMNNFKLKYIYAINTINDVTQIDAYNLKYYKNERLLIRSAMRSYKDFIEGVYRDIMTIIVASSYIAENKIFDYENIKNWNFGEKLNYIESKKPKKKNKHLNLYVLSGGINKIFRHAEAHVDYDIDNKNKTIILRNKKEDSQNVIKEQYSYEDFYMLYTELKETIYSIIIGLEIFISNNYEIFSDFTTYIDEQLVNDYEGYFFEFYFKYIGIKQLEVSECSADKINKLNIRGVSEKHISVEFLENCIPSIAGDIDKLIDIDVVNIEIFDCENKQIGSVSMITKYLKNYFRVIQSFKYYQILLYYFTSTINYNTCDYTKFKIDYCGRQFTLQTLENFLSSINSKNLKQVIEELKYIVYIFNEYRRYISNENQSILSNMKSLLYGVINQIENLFNENKLNEQQCIEYIYKSILDLYNKINFQDNSKLIENTNQKHKKIKVGRNESCPCGSGKKFKKCCGK